MAAHVFHEIYLHLNWHTKNDQPLLTPKIEPVVHDFLRDRCRLIKGVYVHEIGGTVDHVHLAINIEPFVCISDLVGELKGACSHEINQQMRCKGAPLAARLRGRQFRQAAIELGAAIHHQSEGTSCPGDHL